MAIYNTTILLKLIARKIGRAENVEEAYQHIVTTAKAEGLELPNFEEFQRSLNQNEEN
jgi:hypothetical protein